jgi:hypothetical protein
MIALEPFLGENAIAVVDVDRAAERAAARVVLD